MYAGPTVVGPDVKGFQSTSDREQVPKKVAVRLPSSATCRGLTFHGSEARYE